MFSDFPVCMPVPAEGLQLHFFLDPGQEPTEHCLNELLAAKEKVKEKAAFIRLWTPKNAVSSFMEFRRRMPELKAGTVSLADEGLEALSRSVYLEPGVWPLIILTDGKTAFYAHEGYAVGAVPLALKLLELAEEK